MCGKHRNDSNDLFSIFPVLSWNSFSRSIPSCTFAERTDGNSIQLHFPMVMKEVGLYGKETNNLIFPRVVAVKPLVPK
jgi:hypothetical protein